MPFVHTIRPRYAEVDQQGVVFNGHWLTYFDDSSTRFFEHLGFTPKEVFSEGGLFDVMVVKAVIEWKGPAGFDDVVEIAVQPGRIGNASFDLTFSAQVAGADVCEGIITYVSVSPGKRESTPIPDELRARLEKAMADRA